ncbi:MAG: Zn-ribbon domain-containing OB-fold protein [Euryarchaeota archaeon]|nr:Zn-ribbon domain-containing OB-fold protein [Euryarchaeota archaeon]
MSGKPEGNLAGTALTEEDLKKKDLLREEWSETGLSYTWSAGVAIGTYLEGLKEGRLLGVRCRPCSRIMVPPRLFCEECFRTVDEFVPVRDTGTVNTFAICYIRTDASRQKKPQLPAVIELDGASKGMGILHLLGEVRPADVKIGMKVRAVWKPARERRGDITDIRYFRPWEPEPGPGALRPKAKKAAKPKSKPKPKGKET